MNPNNWCFLPKEQDHIYHGTFEVEFDRKEVYFFFTCECDNCEPVTYTVSFDQIGNWFDLEQLDCNCMHCKEYVDFDLVKRDINVFIQTHSRNVCCDNCINKFNYEITGQCEEHYLPII